MIPEWKKRIYDRYVSHHTAFAAGQKTLDLVRRQFPVWRAYYGNLLPRLKEARIIDLGCGNGELIYWLKSEGYLYARGFDASPEQIREAERLGISDVHFSGYDELLPHEGGVSYDCVILRDVIEHFEPQEIIDHLDQIHSSLKPGGTLIIQTPNAEGPFGARHRYYDFTHSVGFTPSSIREILLTTGFKDIEIFPMAPVPHGIPSLVRFLLWKGIELLLHFYFLIETGSTRGVFTQNMIVRART